MNEQLSGADMRTEAGYRMCTPTELLFRLDGSINSIVWDFRCQRLKEFLSSFESIESASDLMAQMGALYQEKLLEVEQQIAQLQQLSAKLKNLLRSRVSASHVLRVDQSDCSNCTLHGHESTHSYPHRWSTRVSSAFSRLIFSGVFIMKDISDLIYLDNHATTPCDPAVVDAITAIFDQPIGNAASRSHAFGWNALDAVELARDQVGSLINATGKEIVWTSGATESNNLAIKGIAKYYERNNEGKAGHIITVLTEHKAVLDACKALMRDGWDVTFLEVESDGRIRLDDLKSSSS